MGGGIDARWRGSVGQLVQLCPSGGAGAAAASVTDDPGDCRCSARQAGRRFRGHLCADRPAVDPAGAAAAGAVAAGVLHRPLGAATDGAVGLQSVVRWFVGLGIDDPVWDVTVFTKNRDRLLGGEIATKFFGAVLDDARIEGLLSDEHFSVDGTLIQAWASMKSFRPKDGSGELPAPGRNGERNFKGEKRSNETHRSATDDDARLFRKGNGQQSQLCFIGHVLMENRNGLAVDAELTRAA